MHFRIRKNVVQFIRTSYDPVAKGPRTEVVGRIPLGAYEIPEELGARLDPEEQRQSKEWLENNHRTALLKEEMAARTLADTLAAANRWFQRQPDLGQYRWVLDNVVPELAALRKTIKRVLD